MASFSIQWRASTRKDLRKLPSRQIQRILAIADQQNIADQHRVVPGLALDHQKPCQLREVVGLRPDQRQ